MSSVKNIASSEPRISLKFPDFVTCVDSGLTTGCSYSARYSKRDGYAKIKPQMKTRITILLVAAAAFVLGACSAVFLIKPGTPVGSPGDPVSKSVPQLASFAEYIGTDPDWKSGPSSPTSLVIFKQSSDCFVSLDVISDERPVDEMIDSRVAARRAEGYTITELPQRELALTTRAGTQLPYTLHSYTVAGGGSTLYPSEAEGYVKYTSGDVRITVKCLNLEDLDSAMAMIDDVRVND